MKLWQLASLGLLLPLLGQAPAGQALTREQKNALLSRKKWYVTFDFSVAGRGGQPGNTWKVSAQSGGTIELNHVIPGQFPLSSAATDVEDTTPGRFIGWMAMPTDETNRLMEAGEQNPARLPGYYYPYARQVDNSQTTVQGDETREDTWRGAGVGYATGPCQFLLDLKKGTYDLVFSVGGTDLGSTVRHVWRSPSHSGEEDSSPTHHYAWIQNEWAQQLMARKIRDDMKPDGTFSFRFQGGVRLPTGPSGNQPVNFIAIFTISPTPPSTAKLVISPENQRLYERFRPIPGESENKPGTGLLVRWEVVNAGNQSGTLPDIAKVTLRLGKVSRYPGVCMNWPPEGTAPLPGAPLPDLSFDKTLEGQNLDYAFSNDYQVVAITGQTAKRGSGTIVVQCFDGAAIGELVAEAELKDGRILTGELKSQPAMKKLLIPDREEGVSELAKEWRGRRAGSLKDDSDDETKPEGDAGQGAGDGLTVWEEYRGFFIGGEWKDICYPKRKDLFIDNQVGALASGGITMFSDALPDLAIHDELLRVEHRADRVINFRSRTDRWVADQHCLVMIAGPDVGYSSAHGIPGAFHPGPPKNTSRIQVSPTQGEVLEYSLTPTITEFVHSKDNVVAHELGHAIGIYHHGDGDSIFPGRTWHLVTVNGNKEVREQSPGVPTINVVNEPRLTPRPLEHIFHGSDTEAIKRIGKKGGQHSGDVMCMMRYSTAMIYEYSPGPPMNTRVMFEDDEFPGNIFCTSPAGTLKNLPAHEPQSRFGGAASKRGNCLHQFVISDAWEIKRR